MLQFYEGTTPVTLLGEGVGAGEDGQLYVRFESGGVYVALRTPSVQIETQGVYEGHFLGALAEEILPGLAGMTIRQEHAVWFRPVGSVACVVLRIEEFVWLDAKASTLKFRLVASHGGATYQGTGSEFDIAMDALLHSVPGEIVSCYTCAYAAYMSYGDEDLRQGWNCFRDLGLNPATWEQWWDYEDQFPLAIQNMSAFHWCPAHADRAKAKNDR